MNKSIIACAVFVAASVSAPSAQADSGPFQLGLRTGYALPLGNIAKDAPLSDSISGAIPLQLDAAYKITPTMAAGLYVGYGLGMKGSKNTADSVSTLGYGLQANMSFPGGDMTPWAGAFGGMESYTSTMSGGSVKTSGWRAGLQGGADWKISGNFTAGPFASVGFGKYSTFKIEASGKTLEGDVTDAALNEWLTIGVRGTYGL